MVDERAVEVGHGPQTRRSYALPNDRDVSPWAIDGEIGRREKPGVRKSMRMRRHKEAYYYVHPDDLAQLAAPDPAIQAALEDTLGEWLYGPNGEPLVLLRVHPHFRRWCLYQRVYLPELGESLWKIFWICDEDPVEGRLPLDMQGDDYLAHFTGLIGEYREPTREDFEGIERFNLHKYGWDTVERFVNELEQAPRLAAERRIDERAQQFLDENWFLAWDEANGGTKQRNTGHAAWTAKSNPARWRREQRNGFTVITAKSKEEWIEELLTLAADTTDANRAVEAELELAGIINSQTDTAKRRQLRTMLYRRLLEHLPEQRLDEAHLWPEKQLEEALRATTKAYVVAKARHDAKLAVKV